MSKEEKNKKQQQQKNPTESHIQRKTATLEALKKKKEQFLKHSEVNNF